MSERPNQIFYYDDIRKPQPSVDIRPLTFVFLTSIRDVGIHGRNGTNIQMANGERYVEGAVERFVRATHLGGSLAGLARLGGVITDDRPRDMRGSTYSILPGSRPDWIHPLDLRTPEGQLVSELTYNIPSTFRSLGKEGREAQSRIEGSTFEFETNVWQIMRELGADVLISDHYGRKIRFLYEAPSLFGGILNIHPGITSPHSRYHLPGSTPTADAIAKAKELGLFKTGATLHFVNSELDKGQIIAYSMGTPVYPTDEKMDLRYRNYNLAKLPVLEAGLVHYIQNIYPNLAKFERRNFNPVLRRLEPRDRAERLRRDQR